MDLDAAARQPARRVLAEPSRDLGEDLRRCVDEHPALGDAAQAGVRAQRCLRHVVQLCERFDARVARTDEDEAELGRIVGMDRRTLELEEHAVPQGDRVGEILEADAVLEQSRDWKRARGRSERNDEPFVADLELARERLDGDRLAFGIVAQHAAEDELGVRAHLAQRNHHVAWLERPRGRFGQKRRVEHEVLERDDGCAAALEESRDVAPGEASAEDERPATCLASLHGSCLPRWRCRWR